jgi:hypothetical protein
VVNNLLGTTMTENDLKDIMNKYPNLTASGVDGKEDPKSLLIFLDACNASCEWLSMVKQTKKPNRNISHSYGLKSRVESWYIKKYNKRCYVPNGAFIAAAYYLGFIIMPKPGSPNAYLNISTRSKVDGEYI